MGGKAVMWEISELLERIEREKRAAAVRSMIISLILGGACILIGLCWWERLVAPWPVSWQVWAVLSVAVLLPLLSTGADWLGRWWGGCRGVRSAELGCVICCRFCGAVRSVAG